MTSEENDGCSDDRKLRLVFAQDEPELPKKKNVVKPLMTEPDYDEDDDEFDDRPKFSWSIEESSGSGIRAEDISFAIAVKMIKKHLRTYLARGRNEIRIAARVTMEPSEVADAFAEELKRRQTYSLAYLDALISDLNGLLKSAETKRRQIQKYQETKR